MDEKSKKRLDNILKKEKDAVTPVEFVFLHSRSSYLTPEEHEYFLGSEKKETSYQELQKKAKELGLKYVGVSKDQLSAAISKAENAKTR